MNGKSVMFFFFLPPSAGLDDDDVLFSQSKRIASRFSTKRTLERCGCTRKFFLSKI